MKSQYRDGFFAIRLWGVDGLCDNRGMGTVSVLEREMYSEAEAARLLRVPQQTLHYWLEGKVYRGREHPPVIRTEPTGKKIVTWAEFVESALLSRYRRRKVPLDHVRQFISILREKTGVPYPLAHARPWAVSQHLVILDAQRSAGLTDEYMLYAPVGNQPMLLPPARDFLDRVKFEDDEAVLWRPAGKDSLVVIDPERRSGRPSIGGISTAVINEYSDDGYSYQEIAEEFHLTVREVEMAVAYELTSKTAA
jgi:uncharacterized protein (DUF433 family)